MKKVFIDSSIKKIGALLLVMTYLVAGIFGPIHSVLVHANESQITCDEDENACHRLLVHHDIENGCDHDSHIISSDFECELCSLAPSVIALLTDIDSSSRVFFISDDDSSFINLHASRDAIFPKLSRGPPVC